MGQDCKKVVEEKKSLLQDLEKTKGLLAAEKASKSNAHSNSIPRPRGTAGGSSGYILQEAMGLDDSDGRYLRLMRLVRGYITEHLSIRLPITKQKPGEVETVIRLIQNDIKYFRRYRCGWPIYDMIESYLPNCPDREEEDDDEDEIMGGGDDPSWGGCEEDEDSLVVDKGKGKQRVGSEECGKEGPVDRKEKGKKVGNLAVRGGKGRKKVVAEESDEEVLAVVKLKGKGKKRAAREESDEEDALVMKRKRNKTASRKESDNEGSVEEGDETEPAVVKGKGKKRVTREEDEEEESVLVIGKGKKRATREESDEEASTLAKGKRKKTVEDEESGEGGSDDDDSETEEPRWKTRDARYKQKSSTKKAVSRKEITEKAVPNAKMIRTASRPSEEHRLATNGEKPAGTKKRKAVEDVAPVSRRAKEKQRVHSNIGPLPKHCPSVLCDDAMPQTPSKSILELLIQKNTLTRNSGANGKGHRWIDLQICDAIRVQTSEPDLLAQGLARDWPNPIDWESVRDRIIAFSDDIRDLLYRPEVLITSVTWTAFMETISGDLHAFISANGMDKIALTETHAGYYGPMGEYIIRSTLFLIFKGDDDDDDARDAQLLSTLRFILKTAPGQDMQTMPFMAFNDFVDFILVPHTATLLIAEDMEDEQDEAHETWSLSKAYGLAINGNVEDDVLDNLHRENLAKQSWGTSTLRQGTPTSRNPRRHQKKHQTMSFPSPDNSLRPAAQPPQRNATPGPSKPRDVSTVVTLAEYPSAPPAPRTTRR